MTKMKYLFSRKGRVNRVEMETMSTGTSLEGGEFTRRKSPEALEDSPDIGSDFKRRNLLDKRIDSNFDRELNGQRHSIQALDEESTGGVMSDGGFRKGRGRQNSHDEGESGGRDIEGGGFRKGRGKPNEEDEGGNDMEGGAFRKGRGKPSNDEDGGRDIEGGGFRKGRGKRNEDEDEGSGRDIEGGFRKGRGQPEDKEGRDLEGGGFRKGRGKPSEDEGSGRDIEGGFRKGRGRPEDEEGRDIEGGGFRKGKGKPEDENSRELEEGGFRKGRGPKDEGDRDLEGGGFRRGRGPKDEGEEGDREGRDLEGGGFRRGRGPKEEGGGIVEGGEVRRGRPKQRRETSQGDMGMSSGGKRQGRGEEEGMTNGGKREGREREGERERGDPMMDGGSRQGRERGDDSPLIEGGKRVNPKAYLDPSHPDYQMFHGRFMLETTLKDFMLDNKAILQDMDFVHLTAGKCKLNGKRINVKLNEAGKLQVGDWQLIDFIKEYGTKEIKNEELLKVESGIMPGQLRNEPPSPENAKRLPPVLPSLSKNAAPRQLAPIQVPARKLAPLPQISKK